MPNSPVGHFKSARQRIARAKAHIRNLNRSFNTFVKRSPYKKISKPHADGIHDIHKLKARRRTLPKSFSDVATDAIENLRAALDHAAYEIAMALPVPITDEKVLRRIAFPFSATDKDFPSRVADSCPGFPKAIITLLKSFKPYEGGNNTLRALNELANASKHKILTTVAFNITGADVKEIKGFGGFALPPQWDRANNEFVLGMTRRDTEATYNAGFPFRIGFDKPASISTEPFIGLLNKMTDIVEGILDRLEAEAVRVGLFK